MQRVAPYEFTSFLNHKIVGYLDVKEWYVA